MTTLEVTAVEAEAAFVHMTVGGRAEEVSNATKISGAATVKSKAGCFSDSVGAGLSIPNTQVEVVKDMIEERNEGGSRVTMNEESTSQKSDAVREGTSFPEIDGAGALAQCQARSCEKITAPGETFSEKEMKQSLDAPGDGVVIDMELEPSLSDIQVWLSSKNTGEKSVSEMLKMFKVTEVPDYYVKPLDQRQQLESPIKSGDRNLAFVPVVDLAAPVEVLMQAITQACEYGFFQIINHGTPPDLIQKMISEAKEFFALPLEEKAKSTTNQKVAGPVHFGGGSRGDWRDVLKVQCRPAEDAAMEFWPRQPEGFRYTILQYATQTQELVRKLLELISQSLGLVKGYINEECANPRVLLGLNFYPPCPDPTLTMGIREHSDPNTITILLQNQVDGLQVYKDDLWIDVKPLEGALVVNVGDHLQILSNGRYPSCLHRAINNKWKTRMSVATFFSPSKSACIKPAPPLLDDSNPPVYREFIYSDYLRQFYLHGGPNSKVTLSQFRIPKTENSEKSIEVKAMKT